MGSKKTAFRWFRQAGATVILAPFAALAALVGLLIIGLSQLVRAGEALTGRKLGSETLKKSGVKALPNFWY